MNTYTMIESKKFFILSKIMSAEILFNHWKDKSFSLYFFSYPSRLGCNFRGKFKSIKPTVSRMTHVFLDGSIQTCSNRKSAKFHSLHSLVFFRKGRSRAVRYFLNFQDTFAIKSFLCFTAERVEFIIAL